MAKQSPLSEAVSAHKSQRGDAFSSERRLLHISYWRGVGLTGVVGGGVWDGGGDGAVVLAVSCSLQTHASGVLGFSFAVGRRPHAKLNPRTERSYLKSLVRCGHMRAES